MPENSIQYEIDQLKAVSSRLDLLADEHPFMQTELMMVSGNLLRNAILLEVLSTRKIKPSKAMAERQS